MPDDRAVTPGRRDRRVLGFGFEPDESPYHFAVVVPRGAAPDGVVHIEERFEYEGVADAERGAPAEGALSAPALSTPPRPPALKVLIDGYRWSRIAPAVRTLFNARLKQNGLPPAQWRTGETLLAPYLGK